MIDGTNSAERKATMTMQKQLKLEISVDEAALTLGVHARTILNLKVRRQIKAVKVKGRWYVDQPSVMAFKDKGLVLSEPSENNRTRLCLAIVGR
jgi:excisionase family DNA binding protein